MNNKSYYEYKRKDILPLIPKNYNKVLEIGCGAGTFRQNLSENCEYWGVEPVNDVALRAEKLLNKVLIGTYEEVCDDLPNEYFDLIICNDVIEHMIDHDSFLQLIKNKMTKEGSLVGSIPNVRYLQNLLNLIFKKDWEYVDAGILDNTHLRFFTEKSLTQIILKNGFKIEKFIYLHSIFTNPYTIGAIVKRLFVFVLGKDTEFLQFGIRIKQIDDGG